jgi:hypothetical protein
MKPIAIDIVGDEGAAQVTTEALTAAGIPVEVRRVRGSVYEPRRVAFEVRVPPEHADEARAILAALSSDAALAAERETGDLAHGAPTSPPATMPSLRLDLGSAAKLAALLLLLLCVFFFGFT